MSECNGCVGEEKEMTRDVEDGVGEGCTLHTVDVYFCREDQAKQGRGRGDQGGGASSE